MQCTRNQYGRHHRGADTRPHAWACFGRRARWSGADHARRRHVLSGNRPCCAESSTASARTIPSRVRHSQIFKPCAHSVRRSICRHTIRNRRKTPATTRGRHDHGLSQLHPCVPSPRCGMTSETKRFQSSSLPFAGAIRALWRQSARMRCGMARGRSHNRRCAFGARRDGAAAIRSTSGRLPWCEPCDRRAGIIRRIKVNDPENAAARRRWNADLAVGAILRSADIGRH